MMDADKLLGYLMKSGVMHGGKKGRKGKRKKGIGGAVRSAATSPQGLTMLAGLAYAAYEHISDKRRPTPGSAGAQPPPPVSGQGAVPPPPRASTTPPPPPNVPATGAAAEDRARLLIRAMVAAAKADGIVDGNERARILGQVEQAGGSPEDHAFLQAELQRPLDIESLIAAVPDPLAAMQVYTASLMAIDADTPAEHGYLALLAARLNIATAAEVQRRVEAARSEEDENG